MKHRHALIERQRGGEGGRRRKTQKKMEKRMIGKREGGARVRTDKDVEARCATVLPTPSNNGQNGLLYKPEKYGGRTYARTHKWDKFFFC